jgi:hypothetical protein
MSEANEVRPAILEIARKIAGPYDTETPSRWQVGPVWCGVYRDELVADTRAATLEAYLIPFLEQAREIGVQEALSHGLPDAPMTDEEVEAVLSNKEFTAERFNKTFPWVESELLGRFIQQVRWFTQMLRDVGQMGDWHAGYEAGKKAGWQNCMEHVEECEREQAENERLKERLDAGDWPEPGGDNGGTPP